MLLRFDMETLPGTVLNRRDLDGLSGLAFLRHLFLGTDGVMMATIRNISGIDTSTLQNWVKRGWVANSTQRHYNMEQVAHILIINMLRSCMQLEHIAFMIRYINGDVSDVSDDIIADSRLYDYICRILDCMEAEPICELGSVRGIVERVVSDYEEPVAGAKERLIRALEVIVITYCAATVKKSADRLLGGMTEG